MHNGKIGIIDSGVGGLTVVREFRERLPNESILYLGDNINVPYGSKTEEEIYELTKNIIEYLLEENVKLVAVACNTISSILDKYFQDIEIPLISIIDPVSEEVSKLEYSKVGLMGTTFTVDTGLYNKKISDYNKNIKVVGESCPSLAKTIDNNNFSEIEIKKIVREHINSIKNKDSDISSIILGCTHYPIVEDIFHEEDSSIRFINPAKSQVKYIEDILKKQNLESDGKDRSFEIYTTGSVDVYEKMIDYMKIEKPDNISKIKLK